jgi:hypothetical protein
MDQAFALGYAGLASAYSVLGTFHIIYLSWHVQEH